MISASPQKQTALRKKPEGRVSIGLQTYQRSFNAN